MSKKDHLQKLARKVTGNNNLHCGTVKEALNFIAEKAAGESVKSKSICSALDTIEKNYENLISGEPIKYHLYAWDYAGGAAIAYSEKETPVAGDVVFLKEDMEGGKITDPTQLKLIYHVVSDVDGKITVSEHPEGSVGGYVFNRNAEDDYEETITDVRDLVDIAQNGFLMSQKGTMFKGANVNVPAQASQGTNWINPSYDHYIDANVNEWQSPVIGDNFLIPLSRLQSTSQINAWVVLVDKTENKVIMASDEFGSNENLSDVDYTHEFEVRVLLDDKDTVDEIKRSRIDLLDWLTNCEPVPVQVIQ